MNLIYFQFRDRLSALAGKETAATLLAEFSGVLLSIPPHLSAPDVIPAVAERDARKYTQRELAVLCAYAVTNIDDLVVRFGMSEREIRQLLADSDPAILAMLKPGCATDVYATDGPSRDAPAGGSNA